MANKPANTANVIYREDGNILVKNVRLSYPHLFKAWAQNDFDEHGNPTKKKFSGSFIMPVATHKADILSLKKYLEEMAKEAFKQGIPAANFCLRDGNQTGREEYAKSWYVSASQTEDRAPKIVDRNKAVITEANNANRIYAGCWVNVLIRPWAQNNKYGKKVNANLLIVQRVKDDEAFGDGAVPDVDDVMDDISGDFQEEVSELDEGGDGLGSMDDDDIPF